jgi:integrase
MLVPMRYPQALTDRTVKALKPATTGRYERYDDVVPGLGIRVSAKSKVWVLFYRERLPDLSGGFASGRRKRRWTLGPYPALSLAAARKKAQRALSDLTTKGIDPALGKVEARNAESFAELAVDYLERHAKPKKKSWKEDQRMLRLDVLPHWQSRHVKTLTRRDVNDLLDGIVDRGAPVTANRVLALVSRIFTYGIDKDWLDSNPAARVSKQKETPRERTLTDEEFKALWILLEAAKTPTRTPGAVIAPMMARGLQLMVRTGQRAGEVFGMRWADVDETSGWWTIPGTKTKNGKTHRVPLTAAALALLAEARVNSTPKSVISGPDGWVFEAQRGGSNRWQAANVVSRLRHAGLLTGDYTRHDLRRTVATGMAQLGTTRAVLSHVLNHTDGGPSATAVYDRYDYDGEKKTALEAWGRHLDALLTGRPSRVVPFAGKRR